jgi:hypothetical protein
MRFGERSCKRLQDPTVWTESGQAKPQTGRHQNPAAGATRDVGCPCRGRQSHGAAADPAAARLRRYFPRPAIRLIVVATISAPYMYDSTAWRSAVRRNALLVRLVSETWKVMPIVRARYRKSA